MIKIIESCSLKDYPEEKFERTVLYSYWENYIKDIEDVFGSVEIIDDKTFKYLDYLYVGSEKWVVAKLIYDSTKQKKKSFIERLFNL